MHHRGLWRKLGATFAVLGALAAGLVAVGPTGPGPASAANVNPGDLPAAATWLEALNAWRAASDLTLVTEDTTATPTWSEGAAKHAEYVVKTGTLVHAEDNTSPFYTAEGDAAGQNGNVAASSEADKSEKRFVEQWITAPFHAAGMLDPRLETSGFGRFSDAAATPYKSAATLDVIRGRSVTPATTTTLFPGDGSTLPVGQQSYRGGETPDPLSSCAGYNPGGGAPINTGTPLFALFAAAPMTGTTTATVTQNGVAVDSCVYDETTYINPDATAEQLGRDVLASRHQVVVVPRLPLVQGAAYEVSITTTLTGDLAPTVTTWDFVADSLPEVSIGNASVMEGNLRTRQLRFTATLSKPYFEPVTVNYATIAGTASAGTDYIAKSGLLTFAPGANSAVVTIDIKGDRTAENQEAFTVKLTNAVNAKRYRANGTGTIISDDSPTVAAPRVSIGSASLVEGDAVRRPLRFAITLSSASMVPVQVDWHTTSLSASDATDFAEAHGTVTIPARAISTVVLVRVRPDIDNEPNETFAVQLSDPEGAAIHRALAAGTIIDDD